MARRVYDFQMARYLRGRANSSLEVPLLQVEDQSYIAYRKGAIALYTLREHIGAGALNTALRRYIEKYAGDVRPYPTSLDLYAELRAVTPTRCTACWRTGSRRSPSGTCAPSGRS